jgi:hypothetical protein
MPELLLGRQGSALPPGCRLHGVGTAHTSFLVLGPRRRQLRLDLAMSLVIAGFDIRCGRPQLFVLLRRSGDGSRASQELGVSLGVCGTVLLEELDGLLEVSP